MRTTRTDEGYRLEMTQWLPPTPAALFPFFADSHNLERITPRSLHFEVLNQDPPEIGEGTVIDYRLRIHGLPMHWQSKILEWNPPYGFVDEQIRGPYQRWHHRHTFEPMDGGTLAGDCVDYQAPGGPVGPLIHRLIVRRDIQRIFLHRAKELEQRFGSQASDDAGL